MGHKPSNNFQSNRPESGGANHDMSREKSGLTERDKELFASPLYRGATRTRFRPLWSEERKA